MLKISKGLMKVGQFVIQHSPEILTGLGVVGFISSTVSAVKATPKALEVLAQKKEEKGEPLTAKEIVKSTWTIYIWPAIMLILSTICVIAALRIENNRLAALSLTACKVIEEADKFEEATKEVAGESGYSKIKDKIAEKEIKAHPLVEGNVINTGTGNTLYYEPFSNQYLRASRDFIDHGILKFNQILQDYEDANVNDYLDCFNLPNIDSRTTGALEWRYDDVRSKCGGHAMELTFSYGEIETGEVYGYFRPELDPKSPYLKECDLY